MRQDKQKSKAKEIKRLAREQAKAQPRFTKEKFRRFMLGSKDHQGFLKPFCVYALLICIGFVYLNPILQMLSTSFMTLDDLLDSSINWIPSSFTLSNYQQAGASMSFWSSLGMSIIIAGVPTICNLVSCSIVGYGLARFEFPGKKVALGLIIFTFILPSQATMIPTYMLYSNVKILGTLWAFVIPAILAQGINAPIFILIFWQFFRQVPKVLIEAAQIDGAGYFKSFFRISLPSAAPAFITVALFSFVWYWNESYLTQMYVQGKGTNSAWTTLVVQLSNFATNFSSYAQTSGTTATNISEAINMAATLLSVLPLMIMYFILQRYFVESIDRTGITGE
jgi:multiple sugar transport system permease protein